MNQTILDKLYVELKDGFGRNISSNVVVSQLALPEVQPSQQQAWIDALLALNTMANPGEVLATSVSPPSDIDAILKDWSAREGLADVKTMFGSRLFACEGSWFHHDADYDEYRESAFSILWLEDESPWDLVFPLLGLRVPLDRGTHVLFDSANIHGVVWRGADRFDEKDFEEPGFQMFFSTEHQYASPALQGKMGVEIRSQDYWKDRICIRQAAYDRKFDPYTGQITM